MKYIVKTLGKICHYQFSNLNETEVNNIECGEMDYLALVESFLLDKCSLENQKICLEDQVSFGVFDASHNKILDFNIGDIKQSDDSGTCFCPEPTFNEGFENCLGSLDYYSGGGPIFEFETTEELNVENFSYSLFSIEHDDGVITLLDHLLYCNEKLENIDFGESSGLNRMLKIWKKNGEIFEIQ